MNRFLSDTSSGQVVSAPLRWRDTLFFRLALVVNLAVIAVLGSFAVYAYRRERSTYIDNEIERLREDGKVLRVGRLRSPGNADFQSFLDEFCRQMGSAASPGHHIAVFDEDGRVVLRAHERGSPELEAKMAAGRVGQPSRFSYHGERYVSVALKSGKKETIAVAQSLAPIEAILRAQRKRTLASTGILVVLIFGITTVSFLAWVRDPLRDLVRGVAAVGRREFHSRVRPSGTTELRFLAQRVNAMAQALQHVEVRRQAEMERARKIQQGLLPEGRYITAHCETAHLFLPTASVGGDLYDVVPFGDDSVLLTTLDVSGHGVPAALYTALLRTVLRYHAAGTADLRAIATAMNQELCNIAGHGEFATCFLVRLWDVSGALEYVSAGHDPAVVVRAGGEIETLTGSGLPLGVESGSEYELCKSTLCSGDRLFMFTDGLHEVFDAEGHPFGRQRLAALLADTSGLPLEQQLGQLIERVRAFQANACFADDVTLLAVQRR